jgi:hypothetical protein
MITIYAVTPANTIMSYTYQTKDEAYDAMDRLEARGLDVFSDRLAAQLSADRYRNQMIVRPIEREGFRAYEGKGFF